MTSSWMAERDRLLAQAQSLSKSASTARAAPSQVSDKPHDRPLTPQPRPASAAPAPYAPKPPAAIRPRSLHDGEADHQPLTARRSTRSDVQGSETVPIPLLAATERDDLQIRVARFRERQTKIAMERQAYCEEVRAHTLSKLMRNEGDR